MLVVIAAEPRMALAQPTTSPNGSDPSIQRPYVRSTIHGKTVVGGQGERLRGVALWTFQYRSNQLAENETEDENLDPAFWDELKAQGINAVRFVFFDPWQRSHGGYTVDAQSNTTGNLDRPYPFLSLLPEDVVVQGGSLEEADGIIAANKSTLADELLQIASLAAERDMYLLVNYHDSLGYEDPDWNAFDDLDDSKLPQGQFQFPYNEGSTRYLDAFWDFAAPLLKDHTNVFFELMNEPVPFHPNDYDASDVQAIAGCYNRVRLLAPDTHLVLGSFSNPAHFGSRSMLRVTREIEQAGVSFNNASIAFHPYDTTDLLPHSPRNIQRLMRRYPVIDTEQGYPLGIVPGSGDPDARGFGRDRLGQQSMERYNISWFAWKTSSHNEFQANYVGIIKPDALRKRYFWIQELRWADSLRALQNSRSFFARYFYRRASQLFQWLTYF
jgi:hypothetical protein